MSKRCIAVTYDGKYYRFPEEMAPTVERAMAGKAPVRLEGKLVQGADIRRWEAEDEDAYGPHVAARSIEDASALLPARPPLSPERRAFLLEKLRMALEEKVPESKPEWQKRQHRAARQLARALHGDAPREWGLSRWEEFNEAHPYPDRELEKLTATR